MPMEYREIVLKADVAELERLFDWVDELLCGQDCQETLRNRIGIVSEEIFMNIALYAHCGDTGVVVRFSTTVQADNGGGNKALVLQFEDSGLPFNPLEHELPDINAGLEERPVGGLGIFLVRKWIEEIRYTRENGRNILTLVLGYC
ncbi:ATP-binding protein [Breznakiellaceae bacterium SP9]